jgi:hypothetical protein
VERGFPARHVRGGWHYLGQADHLPLVQNIGYVESWIALAVWLLTFLAMLHHLLVTVPRRNRLAISRTMPG